MNYNTILIFTLIKNIRFIYRLNLFLTEHLAAPKNILFFQAITAKEQRKFILTLLKRCTKNPHLFYSFTSRKLINIWQILRPLQTPCNNILKEISNNAYLYAKIHFDIATFNAKYKELLLNE